MNHAPAAQPIETQKIVCYKNIMLLLPEHHQLWLNFEFGIISLINIEDATPIHQQLLSPGEMYVLDVMLKSYPDYSQYEEILSVMTGKSIEKCRERVIWGVDNKEVDVVIRPIRNLLGRIRLKIRPFGIDVKSLINMGYLVVSLDPKKQRSRD